MVNLDIAKTENDFRQCAELLAKTHPDAPLPLFGQPGNLTFVTYDSNEGRSIIKGVIHCRFAPEITHMSVDSSYRFQDASFTLLHQMMEGHLRIAGHSHCYHVVPQDNGRVLKMVQKSGAIEVSEQEARLLKGGNGDVRLRKEL